MTRLLSLAMITLIFTYPFYAAYQHRKSRLIACGRNGLSQSGCDMGEDAAAVAPNDEPETEARRRPDEDGRPDAKHVCQPA